MERKQFKITIDAPREKVWDALWGDDTYPAWTAAFCEGSMAETDWEEGSKVVFGDGKGNGMVAKIAEKRANEFMSFEHQGEVTDGVEDTTSEKVKAWAGAMENYTLRDTGGKTELTIDMDLTDEFKDYMIATWPKALAKLKAIAEG